MGTGAWGTVANHANTDCHIQLTTSYTPRRSFWPRSRKDRRAGAGRVFGQAALAGPGEPTRDRPLRQEVTNRPGVGFCGGHTVGAT